MVELYSWEEQLVHRQPMTAMKDSIWRAMRQEPVSLMECGLGMNPLVKVPVHLVISPNVLHWYPQPLLSVVLWKPIWVNYFDFTSASFSIALFHCMILFHCTLSIVQFTFIALFHVCSISIAHFLWTTSSVTITKPFKQACIFHFRN